MTEEFSEERLTQLRGLFDYYDVEKSGSLDLAELECLLAELGCELDHHRVSALQAEFADVLRRSEPSSSTDDASPNGLSFAGFVRLVAKQEAEQSANPMDELGRSVRTLTLSVVSALSFADGTPPNENGA